MEYINKVMLKSGVVLLLLLLFVIGIINIGSQNFTFWIIYVTLMINLIGQIAIDHLQHLIDMLNEELIFILKKRVDKLEIWRRAYDFKVRKKSKKISRK